MIKKYTLLIIIITFTYGISLCQSEADRILLKDYKPVSVYKIPVTIPDRSRYQLIDMHSHPYASSEAEIKAWVETMDRMGIDRTIILTGATGNKFDSLVSAYGKYGDRFELWCGFDYEGYDKPGFGAAAVKELERCFKRGAKGVGELSDKGKGVPKSVQVPGKGMHFDDPRLKPLFEKCAELHMPVNIHVADPYWMYLPIDSTNDGLMNAAEWKVDSETGNA